MERTNNNNNNNTYHTKTLIALAENYTTATNAYVDMDYMDSNHFQHLIKMKEQIAAQLINISKSVNTDVTNTSN